MKKKPKDITFHYTNPEMVRDLIRITPISETDVVLDAGSGSNKIWYNSLRTIVEKYECEIEDGNDFLLWDKEVDWVVGNPPFHLSWAFTEHAIKVADKGIAWLVNNTGLNSQMTPRRLQIMKDAGFELQHIRVVADKRWFGRYYYMIFEKKKGFISWERKTY